MYTDCGRNLRACRPEQGPATPVRRPATKSPPGRAAGRIRMTGSMSRKGNCWHSAQTESFFNIAKNERVHGTRHATHDEAQADLLDYIEVFWNRNRRHSTLGYEPPAQLLQYWIATQAERNWRLDTIPLLGEKPREAQFAPPPDQPNRLFRHARNPRCPGNRRSLPDRAEGPARAPVRDELHRRRPGPGGATLPAAHLGARQLPDPRVRAPLRRGARAGPGGRGRHRQGSQGHLAGGAVRRAADGRRHRLRLRPLGARRLSRRDCAPTSTGRRSSSAPRGCSMRAASSRSPRLRGRSATAGGWRRRCPPPRSTRPATAATTPPTMTSSSTTRWRSPTARPPPSRPAASSTTSRSAVASAATSRGSRATSRSSASGRSSCSAARQRHGPRSIATCSRSPSSATATAASSTARAPASSAVATTCPARTRKASPSGYRKLLGLASHEYFHSWNVKRIKPAAFVPYDLTREAYTRQLWAFEGLTSYYDDLALRRSGIIDARSYLELLGRTITAVLRAPGRHRQSAAESSFDAWIKYYRQDENTPNAVVSYYAQGALIGLALDLTLRACGSSLDALMRALWQDYGQPGTGVPEDGIARLASNLAGRDLGDFFDRHVAGTEDLPLAELLRGVGDRAAAAGGRRRRRSRRHRGQGVRRVTALLARRDHRGHTGAAAQARVQRRAGGARGAGRGRRDRRRRRAARHGEPARAAARRAAAPAKRSACTPSAATNC